MHVQHYVMIMKRTNSNSSRTSHEWLQDQLICRQTLLKPLQTMTEVSSLQFDRQSEHVNSMFGARFPKSVWLSIPYAESGLCNQSSILTHSSTCMAFRIRCRLSKVTVGTERGELFPFTAIDRERCLPSVICVMQSTICCKPT